LNRERPAAEESGSYNAICIFEISCFRSRLTMGVPKRKTSKMRLRTRKAANRWHRAQFSKCPQCGSTVAGHTVCSSCGYYKGRQVLTVEGK
jgi:large subunit ribosomal protein L32